MTNNQKPRAALVILNQVLSGNTARLGGLGAFVVFVLDAVPAQYTLYAAVFVLACSAVSALVPPPHAGSRWAVAYQVITTIGLNIGWAENHFKPGQSGVRVPLVDKPAAKHAVASAGIPVLDRRGQPEKTPAK
ncbi:hypothetical protein KOEU_04270 [Komagataeibacter europaeus]|uniref:Uncharacterized protein n=2 Tax=Komagataeibacter europaeus TaxID=33995 RepID=A0A0M0EKF4_KOMEU|nr:hypothetical protein [Komagataeibacter europaeus]KON65740.1 hypothetical protein KOEU_04270 [Komagataeibacter europaeus]